MQSHYNTILQCFPASTRKILSTSIPDDWMERNFWTDRYENESSDYSILILDDFLDELSERHSPALELVSKLMSTGLHHWRVTLILLLQGPGTTERSQRLRNILRQCSLFFLLAGLNTNTSRWLGSFLSPAKTSFLCSCLELIPRRKGHFLAVDQRMEIPLKHRFAYGSGILCPGQMYCTFSP